MIPQLIALDALQNNQLSAPCGFEPDGNNYGLLTSSKQTPHPSLKLFQDWLKTIT